MSYDINLMRWGYLLREYSIAHNTFFHFFLNLNLMPKLSRLTYFLIKSAKPSFFVDYKLSFGISLISVRLLEIILLFFCAINLVGPSITLQIFPSNFTLM